MFRNLPTAAVMTSALMGMGAEVKAQQPNCEPIDPITMAPASYYSQRLGASFQLRTFYLPQFGNFQAMRLVSEPGYGSPPAQLGLHAGDVVTRLDGVPLTNYRELDCHVRQTYVRFIKAGTQYVQTGVMYVESQPNMYPVNYPNVTFP